MLLHVSPRVLVAVCFSSFAVAASVGAVACSSDPTGFVVIDGGSTPSPNPTATSTSPTDPTKPIIDGGVAPQPDAAPVIDMTPHFDFTLEGQSIPTMNITAKIVPADNLDPARVEVAGQYEQDIGSGLTSTATFTVIADMTASGTDACGVADRDTSYLFKDTDGSIRVLDATLLGGSCTMKIASSGASGFSSGSATGVLGGAKTKAFTIAWGQTVKP
jgi:hypothetical protein